MSNILNSIKIPNGTQYFINTANAEHKDKSTDNTQEKEDKLFLIGALSQDTNPQTHSLVNTYMNLDGELFSNDVKVSVEGHTHDWNDIVASSPLSMDKGGTGAWELYDREIKDDAGNIIETQPGILTNLHIFPVEDGIELQEDLQAFKKDLKWNSSTEEDFSLNLPSFWHGDKDEYETLDEEDKINENTLYFIKDVKEIYKGNDILSNFITVNETLDFDGNVISLNKDKILNLLGLADKELVFKSDFPILADNHYVKKSGDTMEGLLYLTNASGIKTSDPWASISIRNGNGDIRCSLMISDGNRFHVNQQQTGATYAERYLFPEIKAETLTADIWYDVLTSKNPVTLKQGGTGATGTTDSDAIIQAHKNLRMDEAIMVSADEPNSDFCKIWVQIR
jgi:hypothetical protein